MTTRRQTVTTLAAFAAVSVAAADAKLVATAPAIDDYFGWSVAISGDTAVVATRLDDDKGLNSGSVHVFVRSGGNWVHQQKLVAADGAANDEFGWAIDIDGDTIAVGAIGCDKGGPNHGAVYVYTRSESTWSQQSKITAADSADWDELGAAVAIDGDTIIAGAIGVDIAAEDAGAAYVFIRSGAAWSQQGKFFVGTSAEYEYYGSAVDVEGDTAVVGVPYADVNTGAVYVYTRSGSSWSYHDTLTASGGVSPDEFGHAVSLSGDTLAIGAKGVDAGAVNTGAVYIFIRSALVWSEQGRLTASDREEGDGLGTAVALDGDTLIAGAQGDDDFGFAAGAAYPFHRSGSNWSEGDKRFASDAESGDFFGNAVAIAGDNALVGAFFDDSGGSNAGAAYILEIATPMPADLSGDGVVSGPDLGLLLGAWGPCAAPCQADLNTDGFIDGADLGMLLGAWTGTL